MATKMRTRAIIPSAARALRRLIPRRHVAPLYKYRSMATDEDKQHTLDILDHCALHAANASSFNDPFECRCRFSFEAREEVKNERARQYLLENEPALAEERAAELAPGRWRAMESRSAHFHDLIRDNIGVVAFGARPDDILMWSHYAGRHNGICLQFRCTRPEHIDFFVHAHRVRYRRNVPVVNFYTTSDKEKAHAYALTKAKHWRYEGESRIVIPNAEEEGRVVQIPRGALTAVFLGACISDENRQLVLKRLVSAAQSEAVRVYQGEISPDTYKLNFPCIEPCLE